jgi:hypothetical protein
MQHPVGNICHKNWYWVGIVGTTLGRVLRERTRSPFVGLTPDLTIPSMGTSVE